MDKVNGYWDIQCKSVFEYSFWSNEQYFLVITDLWVMKNNIKVGDGFVMKILMLSKLSTWNIVHMIVTAAQMRYAEEVIYIKAVDTIFYARIINVSMTTSIFNMWGWLHKWKWYHDFAFIPKSIPTHGRLHVPHLSAYWNICEDPFHHHGYQLPFCWIRLHWG